MDTLLAALQLFDRISQKFDAVLPLLRWDVHEPRNQLHRVELLNVSDQQLDCFLYFFSEEDVGILVDHFTHLLVLDLLQVVYCHLKVLFVDVVEDDHLEVVLLLGKLHYVFYPAMGLHDVVNQILV